MTWWRSRVRVPSRPPSNPDFAPTRLGAEPAEKIRLEAKPVRKVALQVYVDGRWYSEVQIQTNKRGVAILRPDADSSDGDFLCDYYEYRLGVARLGAAKAVLSPEFVIDFVANDD